MINAKIKDQTGIIYFIVVPGGSKKPTATNIIASENYDDVRITTSDNDIEFINYEISLKSNSTYDLSFTSIVKDEIGKIVEKSVSIPAKTNGLEKFVVIPGNIDGQILLTINKISDVGLIHMIIVPASSTHPTYQQIIDKMDYEGASITHKDAKNTFDTEFFFVSPGSDYLVFCAIDTESDVIYSKEVTSYKNELAKDKGKGTLEEPYKISSISDLEQIGKGYYSLTNSEWGFNDHYILSSDIDLSTKYGPTLESWEPIGKDSASNRFNGSFDGKGFSIKNLFIKEEFVVGTDNAYRGLFGVTDAKTVITNLKVTDAIVYGTGQTGSTQAAGILVGYLKGTFSNIEITNSKLIDPNGSRVGALAGRIYNIATLSNIYVNADITASDRVGGIAGFTDIAQNTLLPIIIENVVFSGTIKATGQHAGGILGYARGVQITNALVNAQIETTGDLGGIVAFLETRSINFTSYIKNSVFTGTLTNESTGKTGFIVGTSKNTLEASLLAFENNYHHEKSIQTKTSGATSITGTMLLMTDFNQAWFEINLTTWDFINTWDFTNNRPILKNTNDNGLLLNMGA